MVARFIIVLAAFAAIGSPLFAQSRWRERCETPFVLQLRTGFDSNPLRLATPAVNQENGLSPSAEATDPGGDTGNVNDPGQGDASLLARPSLGVRCAVTPKSTLAGSYALGVERYASTSLLNTTAHVAEVRFHHQFPNSWSSEVYGLAERSNQPDVLNTSPTLNFANFTQHRIGLRGLRRDRRGATFAELFTQPRRYSRLTTGGTAHQSDTLNSIAVGRWWSMTPSSFLSLRLDYVSNGSNDPLFRYREPIASLTWGHLFEAGTRVELTPRLRRIVFDRRPVSNDPTRTRSDVIPGLSLSIRQELSPRFAAIGSYTFDKDFSSEPRRRFIDHRLFVGADVTLGRSRYLVSFGEDGDARLLQAARLANRGYEAIRRGEWSKALRFSLDAILLDPDLPEAHTNAGIAYYKLGNQAAAIEEWERSLALRPDEKVKALLEKFPKK